MTTPPLISVLWSATRIKQKPCRMNQQHTICNIIRRAHKFIIDWRRKRLIITIAYIFLVGWVPDYVIELHAVFSSFNFLYSTLQFDRQSNIRHGGWPFCSASVIQSNSESCSNSSSALQYGIVPESPSICQMFQVMIRNRSRYSFTDGSRPSFACI